MTEEVEDMLGAMGVKVDERVKAIVNGYKRKVDMVQPHSLTLAEVATLATIAEITARPKKDN